VPAEAIESFAGDTTFISLIPSRAKRSPVSAAAKSRTDRVEICDEELMMTQSRAHTR
jgi:hypothetical protein